MLGYLTQFLGVLHSEQEMEELCFFEGSSPPLVHMYIDVTIAATQFLVLLLYLDLDWVDQHPRHDFRAV